MLKITFDRVLGTNTFYVPVDDIFPGCTECAFPTVDFNRRGERYEQLGFLLDEAVPGAGNNCSHANCKGQIDISGASKIAEFKEFHRFNDPWDRHNQVINCHKIEGLEQYFDPTPILGVDYYDSAYQAALLTPWYLGHNYDVHISEHQFQYRKKFWNKPNTTGLAEGNEYRYESFAYDETDSNITFYCDAWYRYVKTNAFQPTKWSDWQEVEQKSFTFIKVKAYYDTLCSAFVEAELNLELLKASSNMAKCQAATVDAPLTGAIAECADQAELLDVNNIENLTQAADLATLLPIRDITRVVRDPDNPMSWAKAGTGLYLWYKYAVKPTVGDIRTIIEYRKQKIKRASRKMPTRVVYRSKGSYEAEDIQVKYGASVDITPSAQKEVVPRVLTRLDQLGLSLTPLNAWDMLPYSFVVDWFGNTQEILGVLSLYCHSYRYSVNHVHTFVKSKVTWPVVIDGSQVGSLTASYYERDYSLVLPPLKLQGKEAWQSNIMAGSALIVGRL
jgi:hypothetical protein